LPVLYIFGNTFYIKESNKQTNKQGHVYKDVWFWS
jgi:hypothetical protein